MRTHRSQWTKKRFGNIGEDILGEMKSQKEIIWPSLEQEYVVRGNTLTYRMIADIEAWAGRIAEIFTHGVDEMVGNPEIQWHQHPEEILRKVQSGDWKFYGCFLADELIAAQSMHIVRGDRIMEWVWGCVDPPYRGLGVWKNIGRYTDRIVEESGADVGSVWVVTSHPYSQMTAEAAGYLPMGFFIGKRLYGGSDDRYYRHSLILYVKHYGPGKEHLQNWESMQLTDRAARIVKAVRDLWQQNGADT